MRRKKLLPLVSVVIPAYNRADLIEETIQSILKQDYLNFEVIIVDDGSTDNTLTVINKYKKRIKIVTQKNMGEVQAVNKGFFLAKGELLIYISSDDPVLPNFISTMVDFMQLHPKLLAAYPDWRMIDEYSRTIQEVRQGEYNYLTMVKEHHCLPGPGTFFRRKALMFTGGKTTKFKYVADFAFWLKIGMYGPIGHVPKTLVTFRVHRGSQGFYARGETMALEHVRLVDWLYQDPDLPKKAIPLKRQAYASAYFHASHDVTSITKKSLYYFKSFMLSPIIFLGKIRYELVKIKHILLPLFSISAI